MNVKWIVSRGHSNDRVFADPIFKRLKKFLVFKCSVKRSRVFNQVATKLTVHIRRFNVTAIEAESSENLLLTSRSFSSGLRFFKSWAGFAMGWTPCGDKTRSKTLVFFRRKNVLSGGILRPAFRRRVWNSLWLWTSHFCMVTALSYRQCEWLLVSSWWADRNVSSLVGRRSLKVRTNQIVHEYRSSKSVSWSGRGGWRPYVLR